MTAPTDIAAEIKGLANEHAIRRCQRACRAVPFDKATKEVNKTEKALHAAIDRLAALAAPAEPPKPVAPGGEARKPLAWMRRHPDGAMSPRELLSDEAIEDVRKRSGAWVPLYPPSPQAAEPVATAEDTARLDFMERNPRAIVHATGYRGSPDSWSYTGPDGRRLDAPTLRAAIDAVLRGEGR